MLDVVHQEYIRTARAKGAPEYLVIWNIFWLLRGVFWKMGRQSCYAFCRYLQLYTGSTNNVNVSRRTWSWYD